MKRVGWWEEWIVIIKNKTNQDMAMNYRKFSNTVKGMYIRWGGDIFPDYRDVSGPNESHKRLQRAKPIVILILKQVKKKQKFNLIN